jgi:endonuclease YncB( thermonuclease family)
MFLYGGRFGFAPGVVIPAAAFAVGLAAGVLLRGGPAPTPAKAATATPAAFAGSAMSRYMPRYPVERVRVIDGDTFEARVGAWPGIEIVTKVRLREIDAPELRGRCAQESALARSARDALAAMLAEGPVSIGRVSLDKYGGRVLADTSTPAIGDVASALLAAGHARPYAGRQRQSWCG